MENTKTTPPAGVDFLNGLKSVFSYNFFFENMTMFYITEPSMPNSKHFEPKISTSTAKLFGLILGLRGQ